MELRIIESNNQRIAELVSDHEIIVQSGDILDLMADAYCQGIGKLILHEKNLHSDFFDLKTKRAGEILQKCSNYKMAVAIVGAFEKYTSSSFKAFIIECNRSRNLLFVKSIDDAIQKWLHH